jgi:hypothetical protein
LHHRTIGGNEKQPHHVLAVFGHVVVEDLEVELGVLHRHRDVLADLVAKRGAQFLFFEEGNVDLADHHTLVGDADHDVLGLELRAPEELSDRLRHGAGIHDLTGLHRADRERDLNEALEGATPTPGGHHRRPYCRRADVQPNARGR